MSVEDSNSKSIPALIELITKIEKNVVREPILSVVEARIPASLFAAAFAKNHVPINNEENYRGASFVTKDSPTGEKQSSPQVIIK